MFLCFSVPGGLLLPLVHIWPSLGSLVLPRLPFPAILLWYIWLTGGLSYVRCWVSPCCSLSHWCYQTTPLQDCSWLLCLWISFLTASSYTHTDWNQDYCSVSSFPKPLLTWGCCYQLISPPAQASPGCYPWELFHLLIWSRRESFQFLHWTAHVTPYFLASWVEHCLLPAFNRWKSSQG